MKAAAAKLTAHAPRTDAELKAGSTAEYASTMTLRGGKQKSAAVKEYPNAKAKDIGDRMHILSNLHAKLPESYKDQFNRDKAAHRKFDKDEARKWARIANGIVSFHANKRILEK